MQTQVVTNKMPTNSPILFSQFWQDFKVVIQPYWYPTERSGRAFSEVIRSWGMLLLLLLLIIVIVVVKALESFWSRYVLDIVIEERDLSTYFTTLWLSVVFIIALTLLVGLSKLVRKKLALDWYKWLSNYIIYQYLKNRAYYRLNFQSNFDNADQRLAQEIEPITTTGLVFLTAIFENALQMTTFILILWTISQQIAIYLIIYTIVGNLIAVYLTQELDRINQKQLEYKANYNYTLTHLRNHAESIAFFQGENQELNIIEDRFSKVLQTNERRINWEKWQDIFRRFYQSAINVFSMIILTPLFIADKIDYGEISQTSFACLMFSNALGNLIGEWGRVGQWLSYIQRLADFSQVLQSIIKSSEGDKLAGKKNQILTTIKTIEDNRFAFENVTLQTPDYEKIIIENLSLSVPLKKGLLIVGTSGRGKSSLLRAIAGLWDAGTGCLFRPPLKEILFLPQRPYIILGSLRQQLLYPYTNGTISDPEIKAILQEVNLENLSNFFDNFDQEVPWENILSVGEQQRLAFARILVSHPKYIILDEATSALDLNNEINLYQKLKQMKSTFITVGHRESLLNYHHQVLELLEDYKWRIWSVEDYRQSERCQDISLFENELENPSVDQLDLKENSQEDRLEEILKEPTNLVPLQSLSHQEIQFLTNYTIGTIRNKATQGKTIKTKEGLSYYYNKDPKVRKWIKI